MVLMHGLGAAMSNDWPRGWYNDEADQPGGAGRRSQPGFTPRPTQGAPAGGSRGQNSPRQNSPRAGSADDGWYGPGNGGEGARNAAGPSQGAWPSQPPSRLGPPSRSGGGGGGGYRVPGRGGRRWLRPRRILAILAGLVALIVVAAVAVYFSVNSKLTKADVLVSSSLTSAGTNWLITGSDSRAGLSKSEENQLALGHDISGQRSDTILLLHLPANGTRPTLVSLPRDSYVPIPGHGYNKLNAAYAFGGPKLLVQTVQNVTGLPISHYMGIGFGGLVSVVNDVGGVRICLPAAMKDPKAGLNLKAGCQVLNGDQALGFVRTRNFAISDLQREQDQRILIKGILSKMTSPGTLVNPFAVIPAANGAAGAITIDQGTGLTQLISVAFALRNPVTTTVPIANPGLSTAVGSAVEWNRTVAKQFFSDLAHDQALPKDLVTGSAVQGTA
jgi:LCP family protein required for cell wall assembly